MKNPKLITKPFAQNGQKNPIPENYSSSMESNQATWDTGFGQITMIPVAAGGLPPKGQDFNGIFNQISENVVYLSKGGRFKFSADYAASIEGYPKGAILQSDDETKEYQSIIDNNKVNFNTATQAQINAAWKLFSTDDMLQQLAGKQPAGNYALEGDSYTKVESDTKFQPKGNYAPAGNYQPAGDYATNIALNNGLGLKLDKTGGELSGPLNIQRLESNRLSGTNKQVMNAGASAVYVGNTADVSEVRLQTSNGNVKVDAGTTSYRIYHEGFKPTAADVGAISTTALTQNAGTSTNNVMSQKAVTDLINSVCPIGSSMMWNTSAPIPTNFWPNEGRSFSASEYPELAKIFTNLRLPDDRGYAIRAADNGKGIDAERTVGTYQEDAIQEITGNFNFNGGERAEGSGAFIAYSNDDYKLGHSSSSDVPSKTHVSLDISRVARTANETRMKNVAKILITRVK